MTNDVVDRIAETLPMELGQYKLVNFTSQLVNKICGTQLVSYLSEDQKLMECAAKNPTALLTPPLTPDQLVYCGPTGLLLDEQDDAAAERALGSYWRKYGQPPRVVIVKQRSKHHVLTLGQSLQKCKDSEAVLKSLVLLLAGGGSSEMQPLTDAEVDYLGNWEAEKYRQRL